MVPVGDCSCRVGPHTHTHTVTFSAQCCLPEIYRISRPIRCTVIFLLEILEKINDECILILVIYWKKTELLHTKISNHNIIYSSETQKIIVTATKIIFMVFFTRCV